MGFDIAMVVDAHNPSTLVDRGARARIAAEVGGFDVSIVISSTLKLAWTVSKYRLLGFGQLRLQLIIVISV
jgi:hypothetical protein